MYIGLLSVSLAGLPRQAAISEVTWKVKEGNGNYSLLAYHLEGTIKEQHVYPINCISADTLWDKSYVLYVSFPMSKKASQGMCGERICVITCVLLKATGLEGVCITG